MFKKLALLSVMLSLGACETINQASQCDPEKNYIKSNPTAMDEYKELRKKGEVKSYYMLTLPTPYCNDTLCASYNNKDFLFYEQYFDDSNRRGVYTITATSNKSGQDCIPQLYTSEKLCYEAVKNNNNEVKSRYKYVYDTSKKGQTVISLYDNKANKQLYEYSYQIYSHGAIGGPGFGTCPATNNHPDYKFNAVSFVIDN